ncbi:MAG: bifunctional adenosylcobinamide kinase/adenosylcobinamide-phosphate guanylyltransferase [Spirochaetia bacterium]|nr:bifunctional adenosylcobinamide kinase/adenosylcobinamide-phosphate guanylyltransferase [Spirochaetia bacterium]MCF7942107.1 bifunctional adenosylcobinamide kinase/adenosylcobinamide-phosphate guanylyltransferase [Spirochaetia bacterium]
MAVITLILGGTKSGKTTFAQDRAAARQREAEADRSQVLYTATARVLDDEMASRVAKHIAGRPASWKTWEQSRALHAGIRDAAEGCCAVIIDCFTMLATNIILDHDEQTARDELQKAVTDELGLLLDACDEIDGEVLIISNHVEAGLVSANRLGRLFQDVSGVCHQIIAAQADSVYLMTAGLAQQLK